MTTGENVVPWALLDPETCERLIAVLLSRLHPSSRRVDGSGGDGGRDVVFPSDEGPEIFEIKSFTGRLSKSQRAQIKRSLDRAADHSPSRWHLVVPIQPTPGEGEWFDQSCNDVPFPCEWNGLDWLDGHMATHRDIREYFVEGSADRVVEVLRSLQKEQAALAGGVDDAVERLQRLARQVDELNPFFRYALSVDGESVSVSVVPKYPGALEDSPITIRGSFVFDDSEEGLAAAKALQDALDYGTSATVPGRYIKDLELDGAVPGTSQSEFGDLVLGSVDDGELPDADVWLQVVDGHVVAALPLRLAGRRRGARGGELDFTDHTGAIQITLRMDPVSLKVNLSYSYRPSPWSLPSHQIPCVRMLLAITSGAAVELVMNGHVTAMGSAPAELSPSMTEGHLSFLNDLALFQDHTGVYFALPEAWTDEELEALHFAVRLIRGETIESTPDSLTFNAYVDRLDELRSTPSGETEGAPIIVEQDLSIELAGHTGRIGRIRRTATVSLREIPRLPEDHTGPTVEIPLDLVGDRIMRTVLIREDETGRSTLNG